jgi:hypothetical protein
MMLPTTYEYWETLIDMDIDMDMGRADSLIMLYVTKYHYGATWLMKKCYERGKIDLALRILNTIKITAESTRYIETLAKHTKLITALAARLCIHKDYLLEIATRNYNTELLEILVNESFDSSNVRTILWHSHYTPYHKAIVTWLYMKCISHPEFISAELVQQIKVIYRRMY